jgi:NAD(P)-dependent dehydrogenase (short-subunit alcohol dehydrogenase family)
MDKNILIIGATSAIAEASARIWAAEGAQLYLIGRNPDKLALVSRDLESRGARVSSAELDVNEFSLHAPAIESAFRTLSRVDVVLVAHGDLPDQAHCEQSEAAALRALSVNAASVISLLTIIANRLQEQRSGVIAVIGSVAGDRGRKSNYVYGSCKAMVATFMEGLAGRLRSFGVGVITIKPGFVDTPMTAQFKKGLLWAQPAAIAAIIHARVASASSGTYYAPRFWWAIMAVIRTIPARILYRLNI